MDQPELQAIAGHFEIEMPADPIVPLSRRGNRAVWRWGDFALKWMGHPANARKVAEVSRYLFDRGIPVPTLVRPLPFQAEEGSYILMKWVDGRRLQYDEPGAVDEITRLLARFIAASEGCARSGSKFGLSMLDWKSLWEDRRSRLIAAAEKAAGQSDPFSTILQGHLPWLTERVEWCLEQLPRSGAAQMREAALANPLLGHGDYNRDNLLVQPDGSFFILDLDAVAVSFRIWDLSRLVTWIGHDLGWSAERFERMVNTFGCDPLERELLGFDQVVPHLITDMALEYYASASKVSAAELERALKYDRKKLDDLQLGPKRAAG